MNASTQWIKHQGPNLLSALGIQSNQLVLDFGCGKGSYTLASAKQVGKQGKIYALDETSAHLKTIKEKAETYQLTNIEYVNTQGSIKLPLTIPLVDTILAFDVLHFFDEKQRKNLYQEFYDHLKKQGTLIIYPKHTSDNQPMWNLASISTTNLIQEIKEHKFSLKETKTVQLIHDYKLEKGTILIFSKQ
jgi:ubiquinone/menaquinone biosynthesis C-methylase UbiE